MSKKFPFRSKQKYTSEYSFVPASFFSEQRRYYFNFINAAMLLGRFQPELYPTR